MDVGKKEWVPLFDKYNVTIVSENHTHAFKRSKKLRGGKEDPNGTIYIGEGNWGAQVPSLDYFCVPYNVNLTEKVSNATNVWLLEIDNTRTVKATAFGVNGDTIDKVDIEF